MLPRCISRPETDNAPDVGHLVIGPDLMNLCPISGKHSHSCKGSSEGLTGHRRKKEDIPKAAKADVPNTRRAGYEDSF